MEEDLVAVLTVAVRHAAVTQFALTYITYGCRGAKSRILLSIWCTEDISTWGLILVCTIVVLSLADPCADIPYLSLLMVYMHVHMHAQFVTNMQKYMQVHIQKNTTHSCKWEQDSDIHKPDISKQRCMCVSREML